MSWNPVYPDGTKSVRANNLPGQQNTTYIKTIQNRDHYWDAGGVLDGHHKKVEMPVTGGFSLGAQMDGAFYMFNKTATESPAVQKAEPFNITKVGAATHTLQMGFRVMACWEGGSVTPVQGDVKYSLNINTQAAGTPGIVRDGTGRYTINFSTALPSANYIVSGNVMRSNSSSSTPLVVSIRSGASKSDCMTTTFVKIDITDQTDGTHRDPLVTMINIVGG